MRQFSTRAEALAKAVQLLDEASTLLGATTIPASFITRQLAVKLILKTHCLHLSARYNNMLGNNDAGDCESCSSRSYKKIGFFLYQYQSKSCFSFCLGK